MFALAAGAPSNVAKTSETVVPATVRNRKRLFPGRVELAEGMMVPQKVQQ